VPKFVLLWTDAALLLIALGVWLAARRARRSPTTRATWAHVARQPSAMCAAVVLTVFAAIALLDSLHYRPRLAPAPHALAAAPVAYAPVVKSVLDALLEDRAFTQAEKTYSAPLATRQFNKETVLVDGVARRDFPRLRFGGAHLQDESDHARDVVLRLCLGGLGGLALALVLAIPGRLWRRRAPALPWRAMWLTLLILCLVGGALFSLAGAYHPLGTDRTGRDVLWQALKSIRTALVIGSLTTLTMLPPALGFGIAAGYFKGKVDDAIQYLYTVLTAIPGVLLVAACVLMMQVYLGSHAEQFPTSLERADLRLFLLCMVLGLTGWAGLCRLLRAETLKLRELEYIQAARTLGVSHWGMLRQHLLPNVMHIVLIAAVLEFSGLVLVEAVLSYLGIGVDPVMHSFGSMIDMARMEMAREPMIWWNLATAFAFLLTLVLCANLFADAVRNAFDPRTRTFQPQAAWGAQASSTCARTRAPDSP